MTAGIPANLLPGSPVRAVVRGNFRFPSSGGGQVAGERRILGLDALNCAMETYFENLSAKEGSSRRLVQDIGTLVQDTETLLATAENMQLHVDTGAGRAGPAAPEVLERLRPIAAAQAALPAPEGAGRAIAMPGPKV